jgi:hypothetical protein
VNAEITFVGSAEMTGTDVVLIFSGTTTAKFKGKAFLSLEGARVDHMPALFS